MLQLLLFLIPAAALISVCAAIVFLIRYSNKEKKIQETQVKETIVTQSEQTTIKNQVNYYDALENYYIAALHAFIMQDSNVLRWNFVGNVKNFSISGVHDIMITLKDGTVIQKLVKEQQLMFSYEESKLAETPILPEKKVNYDSEPCVQTDKKRDQEVPSIEQSVLQWFTSNNTLLDDIIYRGEKTEYTLPVELPNVTKELLSAIAEMLIDLGVFTGVTLNGDNTITVCKPIDAVA